MKFYYTYILESRKSITRYYTGFTEDLESRLESHNSGQNPHTARYKPWRIKTAVAFTDRQRALDFEAYLKSPSGRAFVKKRL
ncbi:MAG: GIY-YIG nuclease family protein [Desulfobacteraceae bacterium]|nr:GIY-YIG nuclease family protein [Desulfobacteraceae bacterium]